MEAALRWWIGGGYAHSEDGDLDTLDPYVVVIGRCGLEDLLENKLTFEGVTKPRTRRWRGSECALENIHIASTLGNPGTKVADTGVAVVNLDGRNGRHRVVCEGIQTAGSGRGQRRRRRGAYNREYQLYRNTPTSSLMAPERLY